MDVDMDSCNKGEEGSPVDEKMVPGGLPHGGGGGGGVDVPMRPADSESDTREGAPMSGGNAEPGPVQGGSGGGAPAVNQAGADDGNGGMEVGEDQVMIGVKQINPLVLYNVVKEVMKFLPTKELEAVRVVSPTWNTEACGLLRKREKTMVFLYPGSVQIYNNAMGGTRNFPHGRFEFSLDNMSEYAGNREPGLAQFWEKFGPHIMALDLRQERIFWGDLVGILEKVPNLERLELRFLPRQEVFCTPLVPTRNQSVKIIQFASFPSQWDPDGDIRLIQVLQAFPQLQEIQFLPFQRDDVRERVRGVVMNALVQPEVSLPQLKRIGFNLELDQNLLAGIASKAFPFQRLHTELMGRVDASIFKNLIVSLVPTLVELKITFPHSFIRNADVIRSGEHPQEWLHLLTNLRSLHVDNFQWPTKFIRMLPTCFPFLTCLHVNGIQDEHLGVIYRSLPNLRELGLYRAKCTDEGVTGVGAVVCQDLLDTHRIFEVGIAKYRADLYIGNLILLNKLAIFSDEITDASIALGLVDLKNLKELQIGSSLISDRGIVGIADKFWNKLDLLDILACPKLSEEGKEYTKEMMCGKVILEIPIDIDREAAPPPRRRPRALPPPPNPAEPRRIAQESRGGRVIVTPVGENLPQVSESLRSHETSFFEEVSDIRARRAQEEDRALIMEMQARRRHQMMHALVMMDHPDMEEDADVIMI